MARTVEGEDLVPRHTHNKPSNSRATPSSERAGGTKRRRANSHTDGEALALRESGKSYSAIARTLELDRAKEAHRSYLRALETHEGDERRQLIKNEEARLDELEQRIRQRDAADLPKLERRLQGLQKLRDAIRP